MAPVLIVGFGVTGEAVARRLVAEDGEVVAIEDHPTADLRKRAVELGVDLVESPTPSQLAGLVRKASTVVPSPGVPLEHPVYAAAASAGIAVVSEVELAWRRARQPIIAVTGTNGKTTVTTLITEMLTTAGVDALAAGNIGLPLIDAVSSSAAVLVAEVSSFQLQYTDGFHPSVSVWLNLAQDHLDWHRDMEHYAAAKARVWSNQVAGDAAVVNVDDRAVMAEAASIPAGVKRITFGASGDWRVSGGMLTGPSGQTVLPVAELSRSMPHDVANALAASAAAIAMGGSLDACRTVLADFPGLPHRVELIGESGGVRYYDDSKATTPASVLAALAGLDSVVLIAGGRNKSLDLGVLADGADHIRAVVALGEAADEVEAAFAGRRPVSRATSMQEAVEIARALAQPGYAVLLSPGCASFDMYRNYGARGDHFAALVRELGEEPR